MARIHTSGQFPHTARVAPSGQLVYHSTCLPRGNPNYDISPEGRFVFVENLSGLNDAGSRQINVVLNWHQELKERVPVN